MTPTELQSLFADRSPVRLTKLSGLARRFSGIFIGYWLEGILGDSITVGKPVVVLRHRRSRRDDDPIDAPETIEGMGIFESSKIVRIEQNLLYTENSVWQIERVNPTPLSQP